MQLKSVIYQLDKNENCSFEYVIQAEITENELNIENLSEFFARKIMLIYEKQTNLAKKGIKNRFFHLARTKPLYFYCAIDNQDVVNTELFESLKIRISEADTREKMQAVLQSMIEVLNEKFKF